MISILDWIDRILRGDASKWTKIALAPVAVAVILLAKLIWEPEKASDPKYFLGFAFIMLVAFTVAWLFTLKEKLRLKDIPPSQMSFIRRFLFHSGIKSALFWILVFPVCLPIGLFAFFWSLVEVLELIGIKVN